MKSFTFLLNHWNLFLSVQLTKPSIGLDNGLVPNRQQAIIWPNAALIHWRIYAALGGDELEYEYELETCGHIYTGANFSISFIHEGLSWKHLMKGDKFPI